MNEGAIEGMSDEGTGVLRREPPPQARLHALPAPGPREPAPTGLFTIPLSNGREGLIYVPERYRPEEPLALIVACHGAGGQAQRGMNVIAPLADEYGAIIFAPQSGGPTWDILVGGFGPDVAAIDAALELIYERYAIDPARRVIGGFSDGASYALSVGLANGDIFTHIMALSAGFADPWGLVGEPRIFVSHGTEDKVLPIDQAGRAHAGILQQVGYNVHYVEFEGPHSVPEPVLRSAYDWLFDRPASPRGRGADDPPEGDATEDAAGAAQGGAPRP